MFRKEIRIIHYYLIILKGSIYSKFRFCQNNLRRENIFILPWNIKDEIMEQLAYIREWGGNFAVPVPKLKIIR